MQPHVRQRILHLTQAQDIGETDLIQPLWNQYGTLSRVFLHGGTHDSVIVKHIQIPSHSSHPRGFTSSLSRERKIRSYEVETRWYQHHNKGVNEHAPTPECLGAFSEEGELFLLLEDLGNRGFDQVLSSASSREIKVTLRWLAHFHGQHLNRPPEGLWHTGTYWHLATRPEELANIEGTPLHTFASLLDARLRCDAFPTLVHGDAKLANFLFNEQRDQVAAVDFQYIGAGAAMKDVAYFLGSCLSGSECEDQEEDLLNLYFSELKTCLPGDVDAAALEREWRTLYPIAWADFQRFMLGWSPGHRKLTFHSDATTTRAIEHITEDLLGAARRAAKAAGTFIQANKHRSLEVQSKGMESLASDVVTEIDLEAQDIILEILAPTLKSYDLGLLAEEGEQDDSRLEKHAFWTIDPLDGTQFYIEGKSGYATSIALVSREGQSILGVVYDPVEDALYEAVLGGGVKRNGTPVGPISLLDSPPNRCTWMADRSLRSHPHFNQLEKDYDLRFKGGAVINILHLLTCPNSMYFKMPKTSLGGCAIWDLAAAALMLMECGGHASFHDGSPLHLNRENSLYFNDVGLLFASQGMDWHPLAGAQL